MSEYNIQYTLSNSGLGARRALLSGISETRGYLERVSAQGGLAWLPFVRSRLYAEMRVSAAGDKFVNTLGGVSLVGSMYQSFAPTIPEAMERYKGRAGTMPQNERLRRLAVNIFQERGPMPPVMKSLKPMKRVAQMVASERLFGNLYAEELPEGMVYDDENAPYERTAQISPDVVEKLGTTIHALPEQLALRGISKLSFSTYHSDRKSFTERSIPSWDSYLPDFAQQGLIRQITVSLNRQDLPASTGVDSMARTHQLADELAKEDANPARLGPLPEQIAGVLESHPPHLPLDITVTGDVHTLREQQLQNIYHNLASLTQS